MPLCIGQPLDLIANRAKILSNDFDMFVVSKARGLLDTPLIQDMLKELTALGASLTSALTSIGFNDISSGFFGALFTKIISRALNVFTASDEAQLYGASILIGALEHEMLLRRCFYAELLHYINILENILASYAADMTGNRLLRQRILSSKTELDKSIKSLLRVESRLKVPMEIFDTPTYLTALGHLSNAIQILEDGELINLTTIGSRGEAQALKSAINARIQRFIQVQRDTLQAMTQASFAIMRRIPIPVGSITLFKDSLSIQDPLTDDFKSLTSTDMSSIQGIVDLFDDVDRLEGLTITNQNITDYITRIQTFQIDYTALKKLARFLFDAIHPNTVRLHNVSDDMKDVLIDTQYGSDKIYAKEVYWTSEMSVIYNVLNSSPYLTAGETQQQLRTEMSQLEAIIALMNAIDPTALWANKLPDALINLVSKLPFALVSALGLKTSLANIKNVKKIIQKAQQEDDNIIAAITGFQNSVAANPLIQSVGALISDLTNKMLEVEPPLSTFGLAASSSFNMSMMTSVTNFLASAANAGADIAASLSDAFVCPESTAVTGTNAALSNNDQKRTDQELKNATTNVEEDNYFRAHGMTQQESNLAKMTSISSDTKFDDYPSQGILIKKYSDGILRSSQ